MNQRPNERASEDWQARLRSTIARTDGSTDIVGVGNPLRGDDAIGLEIVSRLRSSMGPAPAKGLRIHETSVAPERLLSRLASSAGRIIIFDAVQSSERPGKIVCGGLGDTKYGFFATHNIPLKLLPGLAERLNDVLVVGVQPVSLEVGEGLSDVVRVSAERIVAEVTRAVEARA